MARGVSLGEGDRVQGKGKFCFRGGGLPCCPVVATQFMWPSGEDGPWSLGPCRCPVIRDTVPGGLDISPVKLAQLLRLPVWQLLEHLGAGE